MKKAELVVRLLMGLIFVVFGLNGFLQFLPMPPLPEPAMNFMGAMVATGYFLPFVKATEVLCGLLLLSGKAVPLALVILAPIVLQIIAFHLFLEPSGTPMGIVLLALGCFLAWCRKDSFKPLFA